MGSDGKTIYRILAGKTVQLVFAFIFGFFILIDTSWLPEPLYAPLYPFWLPSYLAIAVATGVRNTVFPWLESGVLFDVAILLLIYVEAVLLAGLFRFLRNIYQTYQRGREARANS